jgi:hypothetical protein
MNTVYMFRRLLRHLQGEFYRKLKVLLYCLITDPVVLYMDLQPLIYSYLQKHIWFNAT